jgi:hypothetical protein
LRAITTPTAAERPVTTARDIAVRTPLAKALRREEPLGLRTTRVAYAL